MKITPYKVQNFFKNPSCVSGILMYGDDYDKISIYSKKIIEVLNLKNEFILIKDDFIKINKEPALLFSELFNLSLFNKHKIICLENVCEAISPELENLLNMNLSNNYIIIKGEKLSNQSSLRVFFEQCGKFATIPCYKNSQENLEYIISSYLNNHEIQYNREVLNALKFYFQNNSNNLNSGLNKLMLFLGNKKNLEYPDIQSCLHDVGISSLDELCIAVANRNIKDTLKFSKNLFQEKVPFISIIRVIIKYFIQLEYAIRLIDNGNDEDQVLKSLNPPIFFKQLSNFKIHIKRIPYCQVENTLKKLLELEIICKKLNENQEMLFSQYMMKIVKPNLKSKIEAVTASIYSD